MDLFWFCVWHELPKLDLKAVILSLFPRIWEDISFGGVHITFIWGVRQSRSHPSTFLDLNSGLFAHGCSSDIFHIVWTQVFSQSETDLKQTRIVFTVSWLTSVCFLNYFQISHQRPRTLWTVMAYFCPLWCESYITLWRIWCYEQRVR